MTSKDIHNAISSQGLGDGRLPSASQDGMTRDLFGQEVAHASHSVPQGKKPSNQMSATYGRIGLGSLESQSLQSSLESKLQMLLPTDGGMMWPQIWRRKNTPARRRYLALAVSETHTRDTGFGLWQTPSCVTISNRSDASMAKRKAWRKSLGRRTVPPGNLAEQVTSMWATPRANDAEKRGNLGPDARNGLPMQVQQAMWLTPSANEDAAGTVNGKMQTMLTHQAKLANGLNAPTEKQGQLNPAFVCWLMGYNTAHLSSMHLAMQSYRPLRKRLSKQPD